MAGDEGPALFSPFPSLVGEKDTVTTWPVFLSSVGQYCWPILVGNEGRPASHVSMSP